MTKRGKCKLRCAAGKASWCGRLLVSVLFAFYISYVPIHLATETHLEDALESLANGLVHHDAHGDADHNPDSDSDNHRPHLGSDHQLSLTTPTQSPSAVLSIFFVSVVTSVPINKPEPQPPIPIYEHSRPPGKSPPDPLQPRAPPLA